MPTSQKVNYKQFEVSARPAWAFRRWTKFPLFFQAFKPSFEVIIKKVSEPQVELGDRPEPLLNFCVEFSDTTKVRFSVDISSMSVGDTLKSRIRQILLAPTGDARVCLDMEPHVIEGRRFHTLYAFVVSAEATLVFLLLNVVLGGVIAIIVALAKVGGN